MSPVARRLQPARTMPTHFWHNLSRLKSGLITVSIRARVSPLTPHARGRERGLTADARLTRPNSGAVRRTVENEWKPRGPNGANNSKRIALNVSDRRMCLRCRGDARPCADGCRRNHRSCEGSGWGRRSRRDDHGHGNTDESSASGGVHGRWRLHRREPGAGRVPPRCRARGFQTRAPRGHSSRDW